MGKIVKEARPEVTFCPDNGITLDSIDHKFFYLTVRMCNNLATATNVEIRFYAMGRLQSRILNYNFSNVEMGNRGVFAVRTSMDRDLKVPYDAMMSIIYVIARGTYENTDGEKIKINDIRGLVVNTKKFGVPFNKESDEIEDLFKKRGL